MFEPFFDARTHAFQFETNAWRKEQLIKFIVAGQSNSCPELVLSVALKLSTPIDPRAKARGYGVNFKKLTPAEIFRNR